MNAAFTTSDHCRDGVHCATCRDRDDGRRWRESLARVFTLPGDAVDFDCPHGRLWGHTPTAAQRAAALNAAEAAAEAHAAECDRIGQACTQCRDIEDSPAADDCAFIDMSSCDRRRAIRKRTARCHAGRWTLQPLDEGSQS